MPRAALFLAAFLATGGCGGSSGELAERTPTEFTIADSMRISPEDADLSRVGYMAVMPSGAIVVTQPEEDHLRVFGDGKPRIVGRKGGGPGEFSNLTRIGQFADSLWVLDPGQARVTIFDRRLETWRTMPDPPAVPVEPDSADPRVRSTDLYVNALLPDGMLRASVAFQRSMPPAWAQGAPEGSRFYWAVDPEGHLHRQLASLPSDDCWLTKSTGTGSAAVLIPFCQTQLTTALDGSTDLGILLAPPPKDDRATYRVVVIGWRGDSLIDRQFRYSPVPIPQRVADSALDARRRLDPGQSPQIRELNAALIVPAHYPPIHRILLGRDGTVWLEEHATEPGHHWLELDPTGRPAGRVTVAANVKVLAAEHGTLWGTEEDADGLLGIVRFRLR